MENIIWSRQTHQTGMGDIPLILVGGVRKKERMKEILTQNQADIFPCAVL
jgi:2,4-dienoyl-CoA reductase-like NADH-dependent reductase (Old Yellow Enzyme family)